MVRGCRCLKTPLIWALCARQRVRINGEPEHRESPTHILIGAELHGENGLNSDTSIHILQTYVLSLLVYCLEVLLARKALIERLERTYKKFLKQILSLPNSTADPAIYILSGTIPIEGVIHKRALTLLGSNSRLPEDSVEKKMTRQQLFIKGEKSHS